MAENARNGPDTRERLLDAAGEVFAAKGFDKATVREIVRRAGANLNAINYHFGDKKGLYLAVFEHAHQFASRRRHALDPSSPRTCEERLHDWILSFLHRMLDKGKPAWFGKLTAREMDEPTEVFETLIDEKIRPQQQALMSIVTEIAGRKLPEDQLRLCTVSVVGQCVHFFRAKGVITRLNPDLTYDADDIARFADHITRFSTAAVRCLADKEALT